jgi:uncharacterized protein involved in oxidation of intracellular sulfur
MRLGIIMNTKDPESVWNALRLSTEALNSGNEVIVFLLGTGVEIPNIEDKTFDVDGMLKKFVSSGGNLLACGSCLELRHQEAGVCPISTMSELVEVISNSDKVVTFG